MGPTSHWPARLLVCVVGLLGISRARGNCDQIGHICAGSVFGDVDINDSFSLLGEIPTEDIEQTCQVEIPKAVTCLRQEVTQCEAQYQIGVESAIDFLTFMCAPENINETIASITCFRDQTLGAEIQTCSDAATTKLATPPLSLEDACQVMNEFRRCVTGIVRRGCGSRQANYTKALLNHALAAVAKLILCDLEDEGACSSNPCENGGQCRPVGSGYNCTCKPGTTGTNCQIVPVGQTAPSVELGCLVRPCTNGGSCIYVSNMYTCSCQIGYAGSICDVAVGGSRGPSAAPTPPVHQGKVDNQDKGDQLISGDAEADTGKGDQRATSGEANGDTGFSRSTTIVIALGVIAALLVGIIAGAALLFFFIKHRYKDQRQPTSPTEIEDSGRSDSHNMIESGPKVTPGTVSPGTVSPRTVSPGTVSPGNPAITRKAGDARPPSYLELTAPPNDYMTIDETRGVHHNGQHYEALTQEGTTQVEGGDKAGQGGKDNIGYAKLEIKDPNYVNLVAPKSTAATEDVYVNEVSDNSKDVFENEALPTKRENNQYQEGRRDLGHDGPQDATSKPADHGSMESIPN